MISSLFAGTGRENSRSMLSPVLLDVHFMMDICDEDADDDGG